MPWEILHVDFLTLLDSLEDSSVDLIITDPPYKSLEKHRAVGTTTRLKNWFPVIENSRLDDMLRAFSRVLRKNSHCYTFCDYTTQDYLKEACSRVGLTWWDPIIWDKETQGMGYHYRRQHEYICFLEKGKRRLRNLGLGSVLRARRIFHGYPTEKPVKLLRTLVEQSSSSGELVVDPFCGSGSTGEAAVGLGRNFIGGDIQEKAILLSRSRLEEGGWEAQERA